MLLFAGLRERAGTSEITLEGLEAGLPVGELLGRLAERWPFLAGFPLAVARNRRLADAQTRLEHGDEIALLPPVSGG